MIGVFSDMIIFIIISAIAVAIIDLVALYFDNKENGDIND